MKFVNEACYGITKKRGKKSLQFVLKMIIIMKNRPEDLQIDICTLRYFK